LKYNYKIGFIGLGKMGRAILTGVQNTADFLPPNNVYFSEISDERIQYAEEHFHVKNKSIQNISNECDVIIFCVKPQNIEAVLELMDSHTNKTQLYISILAGTLIDKFSLHLGKEAPVVRVMPNTPATIGEGMSALAMNGHVNQELSDFAFDLFNLLGECISVDESMLDTVTGISGSGPAFMYRIADNMAKVGIENGLTKEQAILLAGQTLIGAGKMLLTSNKSPQELIDDVSSPGGTTVEGLKMFDKKKLDTCIQSVVKATIEKSISLSRLSS
jgi:pyrroline-5-carboxylate reductase